MLKSLGLEKFSRTLFRCANQWYPITSWLRGFNPKASVTWGWSPPNTTFFPIFFSRNVNLNRMQDHFNKNQSKNKFCSDFAKKYNKKCAKKYAKVHLKNIYKLRCVNGGWHNSGSSSKPPLKGSRSNAPRQKAPGQKPPGQKSPGQKPPDNKIPV